MIVVIPQGEVIINTSKEIWVSLLMTPGKSVEREIAIFKDLRTAFAIWLLFLSLSLHLPCRLLLRSSNQDRSIMQHLPRGYMPSIFQVPCKTIMNSSYIETWPQNWSSLASTPPFPIQSHALMGLLRSSSTFFIYYRHSSHKDAFSIFPFYT